MALSARERKEDESAEKRRRPPESSVASPGPEAVGDEQQSLQRTLGNAAVGRLLQDAARGQPLDPGLRSRMEGTFGADFGGVRVHRDAAEATSLHARAVTRGEDIYVAPGQRGPDTPVGERLLAHELAHVVQQQGATNTAPPTRRGDATERAAEGAAHEIMLGRAAPALAAAGRGPARQEDVAVNLGVELVPQPTPVSCWAAALTMVIDFRDSMNHAVGDVASEAGMDLTTGYGWSSIQKAVSSWGLRERGPGSALPPEWAALLESLGPLWIVEVGAPFHAVVLAGLNGDGTPDATEVTIYNPWPPNQGVVEYKTFEDFDNEFGLGAGAGAMIVHA